MARFSTFVILVLCLYGDITNCGRIRGGSRRTPGRSTSSPRHYPSPNSHGTNRPPPQYHSPSNPSGTVRPLGFDQPNKPSAPIEPPKYHSPFESAPHGTGTGTVRPIGFDTSQNRPYGFVPPGQTKQNIPPVGHNPAGYGPPPPYTPGNIGQNYPQGHNPAGYGPPPQSPHYTSGNLGQNNPQSGYYPGNQGSHHTVINNNINNHHYNGFGGGYGGYGGYSPPRYSSFDTGSTALGLFLGYSLAKITTPSFLHYNSYDNGPKYDHYSVHHYYHNKEGIPQEANIQPNAIVACVGDSGSFCPANTTSLCTNNGAVMCVASALTTVPCSQEKQTNCVRSSIPCKDNKGMECEKSNQDKASITIPCISTAKIYGNISYVNNSIVVSNYNADNVTTTEASSIISTTEASTNNTSPAAVNSTSQNNTSEISTTTEGNENISTSNITTQASVDTTTTEKSTNVSTSTVTKKEEPQMFCVTILALPAERKLTQGEKFFSHSKSIFSKFLVKALGIN